MKAKLPKSTIEKLKNKLKEEHIKATEYCINELKEKLKKEEINTYTDIFIYMRQFAEEYADKYDEYNKPESNEVEVIG